MDSSETLGFCAAVLGSGVGTQGVNYLDTPVFRHLAIFSSVS